MEKRLGLSECGRRTEPPLPRLGPRPIPSEHPERGLLLRFLAGGTSRLESQEVVRHLLRSCPQCMAVTRPVWEMADECSATAQSESCS